MVRLFLRSTEPVSGVMDERAHQEESHSLTATVLAVDDDPDVRSFLSESLAALGYHAVVIEDGASALAALDRIKPDAMIVDFAMPGMNGAEVARKARQQRPDLPIIFASGYSETTAVESAVGEQAQLLHKPFKVHELQSALHELLAVPADG